MWPKTPVVIAGDTVIFRFHAETSNQHWGYRCVVTGYKHTSVGQRKDSTALKHYSYGRVVAMLSSPQIPRLNVGPTATLSRTSRSLRLSPTRLCS